MMLEQRKDNFDVEIQYSADNKCNMTNWTDSKDGSLGGSMVKMQH